MPYSAIHCAIVPQMCHRCATGFGALQSPKRGKVPKCHGFFKKMFSSKIGAFGILMGKSRKREKILMRAFLAFSPKAAGVRPRAIVAPPRPAEPGAGSHHPGRVPNGSATPGPAPSVARPLSIIDATPPGASFTALTYYFFFNCLVNFVSTLSHNLKPHKRFHHLNPFHHSFQ